MTNEELIAKIREKIERLYKSRPYSEDHWNLGYDRACEDMMEFLIDLEEQTKYKVRNPIFDECVANVDADVREEVRRNIELEEEINRYLEPIHTADIQFEPFTQMTKCARHFAKWGAEHAKNEEEL